jgi:hypothetical protein
MAELQQDAAAGIERLDGNPKVQGLMARRADAYADRKEALSRATRARGEMARLDAELVRAGVGLTRPDWW